MKKNFHGKLASQKAKTGFFFALPMIFGLIVLFLIPLLQSLYMAFSSVSIEKQKGFVFSFAGLSNFIYAFRIDANFPRYLATSLVNMIKTVPVLLFMSLFCAILINDKFPARGLVRVIFFLPIVYASSAMLNIDTGDIMQQTMQNSSYSDQSVYGSGLFGLSGLVSELGFPDKFVEAIGSVVDGIYRILQLSGVQIIIMLAALQSISPSLYEAALVEGAGAWEKFWLITLPMCSSSMVLCLIYSIIYSFTSYDNPVMTLTRRMMSDMKYGYSAAMSWAYFVIMLVILIVTYWVGNRVSFTYNKK